MAVKHMNMKTMIDAAMPAAHTREPQRRKWHQHEFRAMNTDVTVELYSRQESLVNFVEHMFRNFEHRLSRFDPMSELSHLNQCAERACQVSAELYAALETALQAAQMTGGLYDPTILPALVAAGYDRTFEALADQACYEWQAGESIPDSRRNPATTTSSHSFRAVKLDRLTLTVIRPPQIQFDLGGMGKGWTVDRIADLLHSEGPFLLNAGGDLYAHGYPGNEQGWLIELTHPLRPEQWFARVALANRALATSTIAKRRWRKHGRIMHHLIDPRTGQPAHTDALSATVVANRTVLAEIYAKTALVMGVDAGMAFLQQLSGVEACIFTAAGQVVYSQGFAALIDECNATVPFRPWPETSLHLSAPDQKEISDV